MAENFDDAWYERLYQVYCKDENQWIDLGWFDYSGTPPDKVCPNDGAHAIQKMRTRNERGYGVAKIREETALTASSGYMITSRKMTCLGTGNPDAIIDPEDGAAVTTDLFVYNTDVSILAGKLQSLDQHMDDMVNLYIEPAGTNYGIIGVIYADVNDGDTVITVDPNILPYLKIGRHISLINTDNYSPYGNITKRSNICIIIDYDETNNTITVHSSDFGSDTNTGINNNFVASPTPTFVSLRVYMVKHYFLSKSERHVLGETTMGGAFMDKGSKINFEYRNYSNDDKKLVYRYEMLR